MPRDGSGVASQPAGTAAVTNTTVSSTKFNSVVSDIYSLFNSGINPESVDLNGGAIDGATIGGSVPAPATFSTLTVQSWPEGSIASAATTDIGAETEYRLNVTGTVTITSLGTAANARKQLRFSDVLTLTHNATSLILPGGANITTAAGDIFYFESDGSGNWRCVGFMLASGAAATAASELAANVTVQQNTYFASGNSVELRLNKNAATQLNRVWGQTNGSDRWAVDIGDSSDETGSDAGSDFVIKAYDDSGTLLGNAFKIRRSDRQMLLNGQFVVDTGNNFAFGNGPQFHSGTGSPNSVVSAPTGSIYMNDAGGTNTTFWIKRTGAGDTGWVALG